MDAREALRTAHQHIEAMLEPDDGVAPHGGDNPLMSKDMKRAFTQLLVQVSSDDPEDRIVSWDAVRETVPLCVALVPSLAPINEHATTLLTDVVNHAEKLAPTYTTPPPYV